MTTNPDSSWLIGLSIAGFFLSVFNVALLLSMGYSSKLQYIIFKLIERLSFLLGFQAKYVKIHDNFLNSILSMKKNSRIAFKNLRLTIVSISIHSIWFIYGSSYVFSSYNIVLKTFPEYAQGGQFFSPNFWGIVSIERLTSLVASITFFIPSGIGIIESLLVNNVTDLLKNIGLTNEVANVVAKQGTFLNRLFTTYGLMLVSAIPFAYAFFKLNKNKNIVSWSY